MQAATLLRTRPAAPRFYLPRHTRSVPPAVFTLPSQPTVRRLWDPQLLDTLRTPISRIRE
jgi:hypothetical protein